MLGTVASIGAFGLTLLFSHWEELSLADIGVVPRRWSVTRVAVGFLIGLVLAALQMALVAMAGHIHLIRPSGATFTPAIVNLSVYFVLACREEVAFHGYPLRGLARVIGPWSAQLIVALVFAAEHVAGGVTWPHALLGAGVGSLLFGLVALTTKGLAMPIGIHAAWNFGQWMLGAKGTSGLWQVVVDQGYELRYERIGSLSYLVVMVSAILAFLWYQRTNAE